MKHGAQDTALGNDDGILLVKWACRYNVVDAIDILVSRFNDSKWSGYFIDRFLDHAILHSSQDVVTYLLKHGADARLLNMHATESHHDDY